MKQCNEKEGYLLMYGSDSDEIHISLITKEHYETIMAEFDNGEDAVDKAALEVDSLYDWFSQTMCNEDWPYKNVKILGTVHIWAG